MAQGRIGVTPAEAFDRAYALQMRGDLSGAEAIYRAILKQFPKHFQTLCNLGTVLSLQERLDEAVKTLRKALNQEPSAAGVHAQLARALGLLDRYDEALERARRAIGLDPALPGAHATLAQLLANLGRYDEAAGALDRAIALAPEQASLYYHLGQVMRWTADDPRLASMEALAERAASLPLAEQAALQFALAKAYADCGEVERSFRHQIAGGALQRRFLRYDEAATLSDMQALCQGLDGPWQARHRGAGESSPLPVFVLGMPRSGSTLVEQVLASHPKVHTLGERLTFVEAIARVCGTPTLPPSLAQRARNWSDTELRRLGSFYLEAIRREMPAGTERVVDKLPGNFQYVGLIHAALPGARIIHTCRDAVDTCLSIFSIRFSGAAQAYSYDLGELGRYYRAYRGAMAHWRDVLPDGVMQDVPYEDVVRNFEPQVRRIIAHCGLEWDPACLEFHRSDRPVRTLSHAQVRQPIYQASAGRTRPPPGLVQPLLAALGDHVSLSE